MPVSTQRGSSVIYVADSVREFPPEVQDWLGRRESRALAAKNIYDTLALLARGHHYAAIVVSIESVDWNELDFFDYAARLAAGARIYVAGGPHQSAKIEAACKRGAESLDVHLLEEDLAPPVASAEDSEQSPSGAGEAPEPPTVTPEDGTSEAPPASGDPGPESARPPAPERFAPRPRRIFPETTDWASTRSTASTSGRFSDLSMRFSANEPAAGESVVSEEVKREDHDDQRPSAVPAQEDESSPAAIPFPWAPSPERPRRTPPQPAGSEGVRQNAAGPGEGGEPPVPGLESGTRLTPEEIAALLGDSTTKESSGGGADT